MARESGEASVEQSIRLDPLSDDEDLGSVCVQRHPMGDPGARGGRVEPERESRHDGPLGRILGLFNIISLIRSRENAACFSYPPFDDLCVLSRQFIDLTNPDPPKAMRLGKSLCAKLDDAEAFDAAGKLKQKRRKIADLVKQLASNTPNFFTEAQRETLTLWANTL